MPIIAHVKSAISLLFQRSTYPDLIENIQSLNFHRFQANSHQSWEIIFLKFFFQVLLTNDGHFVFSSKIDPRGRHITKTSFSTYDHDLVPFHWFSCLAKIDRNVKSQFEAPRRLSQATAGPSCHRGLTEPTI